jgi:hypothetical protein
MLLQVMRIFVRASPRQVPRGLNTAGSLDLSAFCVYIRGHMATSRDKILKVRFRRDEYRCLHDKANKENKNVSEYVRELIMINCRDAK